MINKNRTLILSDLDGTLLNSEGKLTDFTKEAVKKIVDAGHIFCIATGRPIRGAKYIYDELNLESLLVTGNGSIIYNFEKDNEYSIPLTFSKEIFKALFSNKKIIDLIDNIIIEDTENAWFWKKHENSELYDKMLKIFHLDENKIKYLYEDTNKIKNNICSILISIKNSEKMNELFFEVKEIAPTLIIRNYTINDSCIIEINSEYVSKGSALKYLSSYYGIPIERCFAIGDGDNDISMIDAATWGIAMKNATTGPKLSARRTTKYNNNENGATRELLKMLNLD